MRGGEEEASSPRAGKKRRGRDALKRSMKDGGAHEKQPRGAAAPSFCENGELGFVLASSCLPEKQAVDAIFGDAGKAREKINEQKENQ